MLTIKEAEEILKKEYYRDNFEYLLSDILLPDYKKEQHSVTFKNDIFSEVTYLGSTNSCEATVFEVHVKDGCQNRRVAITQEMFKILRGLQINNALVSFVNSDKRNFRISLLTSKYVFDGEKIVKTLSNPRRYSYSLGFGTKTKTAYDFLIKKGTVKTLDELINRFSVEVVNKQFYTEIATAFTELVGGERNGKSYEKLLKLHGVVDHNKYAEFGVRLIGRIMFCWFLREKRSENGISLVPDDMLSIETVSSSVNYYHHILEPLFFELLNKTYENREPEFQNEYFEKVPYLNGGLFRDQPDDLYKYNSATQSGNYGCVTIPNEWFEALYRVLNQYNFTVDENTAYDIELSIDPEMLGRIFENLLAEINPETGENAKKSTGSFYTPRDIVDYMVDNSLRKYLVNKTKIEEEKLKALISYSKEDDNIAKFNSVEQKSIIDALYTVTTLDPACGSGAFPIGMLQKIVYILQELDPDAVLWFEKAMESVPILVKTEFEKKFNSGSLNYIRKLSVIQNSIFGVDIQPIAVEIARLRCFLSLIIEEKVYDNEANRGINPLPNLDFKILIANSLILLDRQTAINENQQHIQKLKEIRESYFNADINKRMQLKFDFLSIQQDMLLNTINNYDKLPSYRYQQLSSWKPFDNVQADWFEPEWMFGINCFDIVIANPPYIDSETMTNSGLSWERDYIAKNYDYTKGNWDIYIAFFEMGYKLLSPNGIEMYISPDKWISKPFGDALRMGIINHINSILFAGRDVFESALVDSIITRIDNKSSDVIEVFTKENGQIKFKKNINKNVLLQPYTLDILASPHIDLIAKIDSNTKKLVEIAKCENACATSDCYKLKEFIYSINSATEFNEKRQFKIINTGTIGKYVSKWGCDSMRYLKDDYQFPVVNRDIFLNNFKNSYGYKATQPKIIIKGLTLLDACLDEKGIVIPGKSTMIIPGYLEDLYLLLGIINSKIMMFYIKQRYSSSSYNGGITFTKAMINNLPIKKDHNNEFNQIQELIEHFIKAKNPNSVIDYTDLQVEIDKIMYSIYDLTETEIKVIEKSI